MWIGCHDRKENMTSFKLVGSAMVVLFALAGPAMAEHVKRVHQTPVCDPRDPGNPFSRTYDYLTWSAWRRRGSYDDRADYTCQPIPSYAH
jgi:hypothetical protein